MSEHYCHLFRFDVVKVWARDRRTVRITARDVVITPVCIDCGTRRPSVSRAA